MGKLLNSVEYEIAPPEWDMTFSHDAVVVSFSGGKDSMAAALAALEKYGWESGKVKLVFCDTGDEAPETYEFIKYVNEKIYPVTRIATKLLGEKDGRRIFDRVEIPIDMPLEQMKAEYYTVYDAIKSKFDRIPTVSPYPSLKVRHCTRDLKVQALDAYIRKLFTLEQRKSVCLVIGIRRDESVNRSSKAMYVYDPDRGGVDIWHPIVDYTIEDVWAIHEKYGVERNRVYEIDERSNCKGCPFTSGSSLRKYVKRHGVQILDDWIEVEDYTGYKLWGDTGVKDLKDNIEIEIAANPLEGEFCDTGYCDV